MLKALIHMDTRIVFIVSNFTAKSRREKKYKGLKYTANPSDLKETYRMIEDFDTQDPATLRSFTIQLLHRHKRTEDQARVLN